MGPGFIVRLGIRWLVVIKGEETVSKGYKARESVRSVG